MIRIKFQLLNYFHLFKHMNRSPLQFHIHLNQKKLVQLFVFVFYFSCFVYLLFFVDVFFLVEGGSSSWVILV
jgi:hypothetical protein